jgi:hypothetical protein
MKSNKFRFRAFTALMMFWSFVIETISGIILYIVPPGRIANWTNWKLWGLTKHQWAAAHTILGYVFLVFAVLHIVYNWRPILNYSKRKIQAGLKIRKELLVSFLVSLLITVLTLMNVPPFGSIMTLGENLKNSWEENKSEPFIPHAELFSLEQFIDEVGISKADALKILEDEGIRVRDGSQIIVEIAEDNNISPVDIYNILKSGLSKEDREKIDKTITPRQKQGRGYGARTVQDMASESGISVEQALDNLESHGITATGSDTLRDISNRTRKKPHELVEMLKKRRN